MKGHNWNGAHWGVYWSREWVIVPQWIVFFAGAAKGKPMAFTIKYRSLLQIFPIIQFYSWWLEKGATEKTIVRLDESIMSGLRGSIFHTNIHHSCVEKRTISTPSNLPTSIINQPSIPISHWWIPMFRSHVSWSNQHALIDYRSI